jgi:ribosomal protein S13
VTHRNLRDEYEEILRSMARIAGVDLPREKRLEVALTYIYGVGRTRAKQTLEATGSARTCALVT